MRILIAIIAIQKKIIKKNEETKTSKENARRITWKIYSNVNAMTTNWFCYDFPLKRTCTWHTMKKYTKKEQKQQRHFTFILFTHKRHCVLRISSVIMHSIRFDSFKQIMFLLSANITDFFHYLFDCIGNYYFFFSFAHRLLICFFFCLCF